MATHHPVIRPILGCGIAIMTLVAAGNASAAGFALIEQSVSSMGTAYAGAGSSAEDASTVFFNPAITTHLDGSQLSTGLHGILPTSKFSGACSYNSRSPVFNPPSAAAGLSGTPCGSGDGGNGGENGVVPHFTYVHDFNEKLDFAFGVNAPFGLTTKYDKDWAGRYSAIESAVTAINLNPTLTYKLDDRNSIGFGFNAMYARLELENAIDDGLIAFLTPLPDKPGYVPGSSTYDKTGKVDMEDWGYGFNLGYLFQPTKETRIGLAYRSKVKVNLDGDFKTDSTVTSSKDAEADVTLPDTFLFSAHHEINPRTALMADILWTNWSEIPDLKVKFADGSVNTFHLDWKDTVRFAIGASYKYNKNVTLRTGIAHDETPVPNKELRLAALPDDDRIWLDFGIGYRHSKSLSFDLGYAHLFIDDPEIDSADAASSSFSGDEGLHRLTGDYEADTDIISAQLNYRF